MKSSYIQKHTVLLMCAAFFLVLCSKAPQSSIVQKVDGDLRSGIRVIKLVSDPLPDFIHVYRGDAVELLFLKSSVPTWSMPLLPQATSTEQDRIISIKFTAADTGLFPIVSANDKKITTVSVQEYKTRQNSVITNLTGDNAVTALQDTSILVLDVRTPAEFQDGHIPRAVLLPVSELASRVDEIAAYKNRPVFVYCRSGNRSAVALQILTSEGFSNLLHLRNGFRSWKGDVAR
jgi:rhodanese-related sulfurtransferase